MTPRRVGLGSGGPGLFFQKDQHAGIAFWQASSEECKAEVTEMPLALILSARQGKVETSGSRAKLDKMRLLRDSISLPSCHPPNAVRTAPRKPCGQGCM